MVRAPVGWGIGRKERVRRERSPVRRRKKRL